jgi:uncharacterized protein YqcC (DUF446 family)
MVLMHIVDDYYLQGILAKMKQKSWWEKQEGYKNIYKNDYKMALLMHSMSWSIMILLPAMFILNTNQYALFAIFVINAFIHYHIDDLKANKLKINLMFDQTIHIMQVITTWILVQQWVI